jgi:hypothetical protein
VLIDSSERSLHVNGAAVKASGVILLDSAIQLEGMCVMQNMES